MLTGEKELVESIEEYSGVIIYGNQTVKLAFAEAKNMLEAQSITDANDLVTEGLSHTAEKIIKECTVKKGASYGKADRVADRIFTGKFTAIPVMLVMLGILFWITLVGANYPSRMLSDILFSAEDSIYRFLSGAGCAVWICDMLVLGVYRVISWVVSVMLPPMAIFFPLFTILEDAGFLPRIAYNLDRCFASCNACGKQALTMCMGLGCNAAGVVGCRIIDSPKERLIAILTNAFVPCNGRLPMLITLISMFLVMGAGAFHSVLSAFVLVMFIVLGIAATLGTSLLLSKTVLKGQKSSYVLEMPPYRCPKIGSVLIRSFLDRTLFVLGRAILTAAPMGFIIWLMANTYINDVSLLSQCTRFLDPFGQLFGMDGVIIMAFILGLPANEIVIPVMIMAYMSESSLTSLSAKALYSLFAANGWNAATALCVCVFALFHFPCATTLMTIKKETASVKYTLLAAILPTSVGLCICFIINTVVSFAL